MENKISIASCNGMSALGLVGRVACEDLASSDSDIVSICMTATSADNERFIAIIKKYPILAINGCSGSCVNKILSSKGVDITETLYIDEAIEDEGKDLNHGDPARLDVDGEKAVDLLKIAIKNTINSLKSKIKK